MFRHLRSAAVAAAGLAAIAIPAVSARADDWQYRPSHRERHSAHVPYGHYGHHAYQGHRGYSGHHGYGSHHYAPPVEHRVHVPRAHVSDYRHHVTTPRHDGHSGHGTYVPRSHASGSHSYRHFR